MSTPTLVTGHGDAHTERIASKGSRATLDNGQNLTAPICAACHQLRSWFGCATCERLAAFARIPLDLTAGVL
jgi:hypothetical protein